MNDMNENFLSQPVRHLTNEQFDALLLSPATDHPHLRHCEQCAAQLSELRSAIGNLRVTSVAAAERHYQAARYAQCSQQRSGLLHPRLTWVFTAVAGVLFLGLPFAAKFRTMYIPGQHPIVAVATKGPLTTGGSASNLSDDQLLNNIQSDLSASVPAPLLPLESTTSTDNSTKETK